MIFSLLVKCQAQVVHGDNLEQALSTCRFLGVPVAPDKVHGPARVITFLGTEIGTNTIQLCLPESSKH